MCRFCVCVRTPEPVPSLCAPPLYQIIEGQRFEFERLLRQLEKEMKRVGKGEAKLRLLTAGYEKRAAAATEAIQAAAADIEEK